MTILDYILISLGGIIVLPILAYLCVQLGTFGFYRGKEAAKRRKEFNNVQDTNNKS